MFRLPHHLSCAVQPANNRRCFGSSNFAKDFSSSSVKYSGVLIANITLPSIFGKAFEENFCLGFVKVSSFRVLGIWPICRDNVDNTLFKLSQIYKDAAAIDMYINQISKSSMTDLNQVIDTTVVRVSDVNSLFTAWRDTNAVSNSNVQDSISDANEIPVASKVSLISKASCSKAMEKLPSIITSSKLGIQIAETTLPRESSLIL